jgi:hypothetical protein
LTRRLAFTYPTSWTPHKYEVVASSSRAIVYLSNQPLHEPCTRHRSASSLTITCAAPVDHLAPGGVLAMWSSNGFPSWQFSNAKGAPLQIAGRPAKLGVDRPGSCAEIGADETITAVIPRHALSDNWYQLWACLRGPALDQHDREVRQLLASTTVHD